MKKRIIALLITIICILMMTAGVMLYKNYIAKDDTASATEASSYYKANSKVIEIIDATKSKETMTESEATALFTERGFIDQPMVSYYTIEGEFIDEYEISVDSSAKHPIYETYYLSKTGELWTILVVNSMITAYPVNYNLESDLDGELFISESKEITSYDKEENKFYVTIPYDSASVVKVVSKIDAEKLDELTKEAIDSL